VAEEKIAGGEGGAPEEAPPDVFVATTPEQLRAVTERAKVVLSFAGPFAKFGFSLTEACVDTGTHYADITGEPPFIRRCVRELHEKAKAKKTCVVNCGRVRFDSVGSRVVGGRAVVQDGRFRVRTRGSARRAQ
jgi:short subunit dehydrogenase-like uncharacterized protein